MLDFLKRGYNNALEVVGKFVLTIFFYYGYEFPFYEFFLMFAGERDKLIDIKTTVKLAADDGIVTFDEIRQNLRQYDFLILLYTICFDSF